MREMVAGNVAYLHVPKKCGSPVAGRLKELAVHVTSVTLFIYRLSRICHRRMTSTSRARGAWTAACPSANQTLAAPLATSFPNGTTSCTRTGVLCAVAVHTTFAWLQAQSGLNSDMP